jgi:hypothetical protein
VTHGGYPGLLHFSAAGLPDGLSIDQSSGLISGTIPTGAALHGPFAATITASDYFHSDSESFTWTVHSGAWIEADTSDVRLGDTVTFSAETASGPPSGTVEWDFAYDGQTFNPDPDASGNLTPSHTFDSTGPQTVALRVTDQSGAQTLATLPLTVTDAPSFTSDATAKFVLWQSGSYQITTDGFPVAAISTSGTLPNGLWLTDNHDGTATLSGTPFGPAGDYTFSLTAANSVDSTTQDFTVTVAGFLENPGDQSNSEGDAVSLQLVTHNANPATLSFSATALPDGLSIDPSTGLISGTIAAGAALHGPFQTTVTASDGEQQGSQSFTWAVTGPVWIEADSDDIHQGDTVTFSALTSADPAPDYTLVEWDFNYDGQTFNADPNAHDLDAATTFDAAGTRTVAVRLTEASGQIDMAVLSVTVQAPPPALTVEDDQEVTAGTTQSLQASATDASGIASVQWEVSFDGGDYQVDPDLTTLTPSYTFSHFGDYDFLVTVTDNNGETSEDGFHVTADEVTPTATAAYSGPAFEGDKVTFTVWVADPDTSDALNLYADWQGTGDFDPIDPREQRVNADGSISFDHVYDTYSDANGFPAVVRVEDEGGQHADCPLSVVIEDARPSATLTAGYQFATVASSGTNAWVLAPDQKLAFTNIHAVDPDELEYHWSVDGGPDQVTDTPTFSLPAYTVGQTYHVEAYVEDALTGETGDEQALDVVVMNHAPGGGNSGFSYQGDPDAPVTGGFLVPGPHGTFLPAGTAPPANYNGFGYMPTLDQGVVAADTPLSYTFALNLASKDFLSRGGAQVFYVYRVQVLDVEQHSFWADDHDLISDTFQVNTTGRLDLDGYPVDREIDVTAWAAAVQAGADLPGPGGPFNFATAGYEVISHTPLTPTFLKRVKDLWGAAKAAAQKFTGHAWELISSFTAHPGQFLDALSGGVSDAASGFFTDLKGDGLLGRFLGWLKGGSAGTPVAAGDWTSFLLSYAGLTWANVEQVLVQELTGSNLIAAGVVAGLTAGYKEQGPAGMLQFLGDLPGKLSALSQDLHLDFDLSTSLGNLTDWTNLPGQLVGKVKDVLTETVPVAAAQALAKFAPGVGWAQSIYQGLTWMADNVKQFEAFFDAFLGSLGSLTNDYDAAGLAAGLKTALDDAAPLMLSFAASQLGLGGLPASLRTALSYLPLKVDAGLRAMVRTVAGALVS